MSKQKYNLILLNAFFILEYLLFQSYAYREAIGKIPRNWDQVYYMVVSYKMYDSIVSRNLDAFLSIFNAGVKTSGISLIGTVNLFLFGRTHFSFLLLNFFAFLLAQIIGSVAIYRILNKWIYVWTWIGLFIGLQTPFYWAGDLLDFRADFVAFCLYTSWFCLYITFLYSKEEKYCKLSAVFGGLLIFFRMLTITYIGSVLVIFVFIDVFLFHKKLKAIIKQYIVYLGIMIVCGGWLAILCIGKTFSYYYNLHAINLEPEIRRIEQQVYSLWDEILFYPKSLMNDHLGKVYLGSFIVILIVIVCIAIKKLYIKEKMTWKGKEMLAFAIISIVTPMVILTIDESKSSVVGGIVSGCIVFISVISIYLIINKYLGWLKKIILIGCCCVGVYNYIINSIGEQRGYSREEQLALININTSIAEYIIDKDINNSEMLVDHLCDGIGSIVSTYWISAVYEEPYYVDDATYLMSFNESGDTLESQVAHRFEKNEINEALDKADIIVVSEEGYSESLYITDKSLDQYREQIWNYATQNLDLLLEDQAYGTTISVFAR